VEPAVVYAFAGAAHYDSLMLLTLVGSLVALQRATTSSGGEAWRWAIVSSMALGLSIACKLVPLLLVPTGFSPWDVAHLPSRSQLQFPPL
jgi:uncharacterized membrane protein